MCSDAALCSQHLVSLQQKHTHLRIYEDFLKLVIHMPEDAQNADKLKSKGSYLLFCSVAIDVSEADLARKRLKGFFSSRASAELCSVSVGFSSP